MGWGGPNNSPEVFLLHERLGQSDKKAVNVPGVGEVSGQIHRDFEGAIQYKGIDMEGIGQAQRTNASGEDVARSTASARAQAVYADLMNKMKTSSLDDAQKGHAAHVAMAAMSQTFEAKGWELARNWGKDHGFFDAKQVGISAPREIETSVVGNMVIVKVTQSFYLYVDER